MTQRQAVFVGCRLIAVYLIAEGAVTIATVVTSMGSMTGFLAAPGGRMTAAPIPWEAMFRTIVMHAIVRGGIAVMLWAAAAKISRIAAHPVDGDDGWHGE